MKGPKYKETGKQELQLHRCTTSKLNRENTVLARVSHPPGVAQLEGGGGGLKEKACL